MIKDFQIRRYSIKGMDATQILKVMEIAMLEWRRDYATKSMLLIHTDIHEKLMGYQRGLGYHPQESEAMLPVILGDPVSVSDIHPVDEIMIFTREIFDISLIHEMNRERVEMSFRMLDNFPDLFSKEEIQEMMKSTPTPEETRKRLLFGNF